MTLAELIALTLERHASELHVCVPGVIDAYDAPSQTVDVVPSAGDGQGVISQVPVVFPAAGGYALTLPVARGDRVVLVFADASLDEWWTGRATSPADARTHARTDCFALLGGRPGSAPMANVDTARSVLGPIDASSPRVAVGSSAVHLGVAHGVDGAQSAVRGEAHVQAIKDLLSALEAHLLTGATAGPTLTFALDPLWEAAKASFAAAAHLTDKVKVP